MQNKNQIIGKGKAYLTGFETKKEFEAKGFFKQLYAFMEQDLLLKGFKYLTLGVEPQEIRNLNIYFKMGFNNFVKYDFEKYEPENKNEKKQEVLVLYYEKKLD